MTGLIRMQPEVKAKWTEALRSGEYTQTKTYLHDEEEGFCCLGVLCDLAVAEGVIPPGIKDEVSDFYRYGKEKNYGVLPVEVQEWAFGVTLDDGESDDDLSDPRLSGWSATDWNDSKGVDFPTIADLIDEYL